MHLRACSSPGSSRSSIGYVSLRRSGIYFSILTLAFAQMCYNLAYSVLTPITNGETGLQLTRNDPRILDAGCSASAGAGLRSTAALLGHSRMSGFERLLLLRGAADPGLLSSRMRIFRSPFGMMLRAIKSNQNGIELHRRQHPALRAGRLRDLGHVRRPRRRAARRHRPAGRRRAHAVDRLGRGGADDHPRRRRHAARAGDRRRASIKYFENIFSAFNEPDAARLLRLPARRRCENAVVADHRRCSSAKAGS